MRANERAPMRLFPSHCAAGDEQFSSSVLGISPSFLKMGADPSGLLVVPLF